MAIVKPFCAIRPQKKYAEKVISPPYDVMNRKEAKILENGNPYSFLHITRAEIDLPETVGSYDEKVYRKSRENFDDFLAKNVVFQDKKPMFYLYRQTMGNNTQTGLVSCVSIDEYEQNIIKKHELTRIEKEEDRTRHFDACDANTEPVFLTYRKSDEISTLLTWWVEKREAEYDFVTRDGIGHTLWLIDEDSVIDRLQSCFRQIPALYIADGHHRSASAVQVGQKRRAQHPQDRGKGEFNYFMAVLFPDSDLRIYDYNRVVKDLNGLSEEAFLARVREAGFSVQEAAASPWRPQKAHEFGMYLAGRWYRLKANPEIMDTTEITSILDVSILQDRLLHPILGIENPRTDHRIDFVGGIRGLEELERRVGEDMQVAFAVHPVSIEELLAVADENKIMPPKSTWFEPKPGSGLFVHSLRSFL